MPSGAAFPGSRSMGIGSSAHGFLEERKAAEYATLIQMSHPRRLPPAVRHRPRVRTQGTDRVLEPAFWDMWPRARAGDSGICRRAPRSRDDDVASGLRATWIYSVSPLAANPEMPRRGRRHTAPDLPLGTRRATIHGFGIFDGLVCNRSRDRAACFRPRPASAVRPIGVHDRRPVRSDCSAGPHPPEPGLPQTWRSNPSRDDWRSTNRPYPSPKSISSGHGSAAVRRFPPLRAGSGSTCDDGWSQCSVPSEYGAGNDSRRHGGSRPSL